MGRSWGTHVLRPGNAAVRDLLRHVETPGAWRVWARGTQSAERGGVSEGEAGKKHRRQAAGWRGALGGACAACRSPDAGRKIRAAESEHCPSAVPRAAEHRRRLQETRGRARLGRQGEGTRVNTPKKECMGGTEQLGVTYRRGY
jgi:hypothetical protein